MVRLRLMWYLSLVFVVAGGCDPGMLGMDGPVDEDLYAVEVTYCGVNAERLWNPDRTEVLVEPGRRFVASYDLTNLDDEAWVYSVRIYRTIDDGPEELFWKSPKAAEPDETISGRGSEGIDPTWGPDTEFSCRVEVWTI